MAGTATAAVPSPGASGATVPSGPASSSAGDACLADPRSGAPKPKCRQLKRRSTEEAVGREIEERFRGWGYVDTRERRVAGVTLFENILEAKRRCKRAGGRLISAYWMGITRQYNPTFAEDQALLVETATQETVRPTLVAAIQRATTPTCTTRSTAPYPCTCVSVQ